MRRALNVLFFLLVLLAIGSILLSIWLGPDEVPWVNLEPLPTPLVVAAVTSPTSAAANTPLPPTFTPIIPNGQNVDSAELTLSARTPTSSVARSETATLTPVLPESATSSSAPKPPSGQSPTLVPSPATAATSSGLPCADPVPEIPAYGRYILAEQIWPTPNRTMLETHFWLSKPFNVESGFQINEAYPYGNDLNGRLLLHNGVDATEPGGTPLVAVADGTVVVAREDRLEMFGWRCSWYGQLVVLQLDQTWRDQPIYALYGHVLELSVKEGARVARGEQLAVIGSGGAATVPHLHFEVRVGTNEFGATRNPLLWVDPAPNGVIAGRLVDPGGFPWQGVGLSLIGKSEDAGDGNTWSYMSDPLGLVSINTDAGIAENFVFGDVRPGEYDVYTRIQGVDYRVSATVESGQVSVLEIITEPFRTATPAP